MSLLKCPKCGEMFSDSYKTCPFCEEDEAFANGGKKPVNPGRRVHRQKSPSILGPTLVLVLVLVAGVLLYTLIGGRKTGDDRPDPPKNPTEDVDPNTPAVTLSLDQTALELTVGGTGKLAATGADQITWTSSNTDVATVAEDGTVTAVAAGTATISASAEGADPVTCTVTVKEAPKKDLVLRSIYNSKGVAQTEFSMSVGDPVVPMTVDGTDSPVQWSTEDSSIATINSDGEVTAVKSGKTMVVAVVDGQTLKCEVLVN
ncbi:Ig-like domain-containing protein [Vescimonas sp.]|uniref:Ig-like domain-containing protein n=1 Tax=Vescimonas sp. TaxID=2892404 RepID=UPI00307FBD70